MTMKKYECEPCGYIYDPAVGDPDAGIAPETAFEDKMCIRDSIMTVQKIRWAPMITVPEWQQCLNWQGF